MTWPSDHRGFMRRQPRGGLAWLWGGVLGVGILAGAGVGTARAQDGGTIDWSNCMVSPQQIVQLGSPVLGTLSTLSVKRGQAVVKGQVVAQLDSRVEEAQLALDAHRASLSMAAESAKLDLGWNERELARRLKYEGKLFTRINEIDELKTKIAQDRLAIEKAQADQETVRLEALRSKRELELRTIKSPLNGVVTEIKLRPGEFVNAQTPIMTLAQVDPLKIELILSADYYSALHDSMVLDVTLDKPVSHVVQAQVEEIDPVIDPASNSFRAWLRLANPDRRIPAGVRCYVHLPHHAAEG